MDYAKSILLSILNEEANLQDVTDAIKKRYEVEINYKADENPKGKGKRVIQPVVLGHSKAGNLIVRAFQPFGDTQTKTPHWKTFRLDRIDNWKAMKKRRFNEPPDSQYNAEGKYNPDGDGSMIDVLVQADFTGSQKYQRGERSYKGLKQANDERAAKKRENDPLYGLKQNIKKSYNANNIDYIRKNIEDWQKSQAAKDFKRGNYSSASEMSQITDFGEDKSQQTVGPVTKQNTEVKTISKGNNYANAYNNGPVYKNKPIINNTEENKEEENDEYREINSSSTENDA